MSKEVTTVKDLIATIAAARNELTPDGKPKSATANSKDEVRVAVAMLNDPSYVVDIYDKTGVCGQYSPYADTRDMLTSIIKNSMQVEEAEARKHSEAYQFTKATAQTMVNFSKEYINTYLQTERKLPLGGRATSNAALTIKHKEARDVAAPFSDDPKNPKMVHIPAYDTIKVSGSCPAHVKGIDSKDNDSVNE